MTITEFILAGLAEDDAIALRTGGDTWEEWALGSGDAEHMANWDPARALRENEAKRRIVALHLGTHECVGAGPGGWDGVADEDTPCPTLNALAKVYADHPDFREEWRT